VNTVTIWEVEIERIMVQDQKKKKILEIPISTNGWAWW
jgi:hypothetical protein